MSRIVSILCCIIAVVAAVDLSDEGSGFSEEDWLTDTVVVSPTITLKHDVDVGEVYKSFKKIVQMYKVIDKTRVYLDGSNNQVQQYIINDLSAHDFLNFIHYSLVRNSLWDMDNQVVLRHQLSLNYFCITNCGVAYMSPNLTMDCIFDKELVQDVTATLETVYLRKNIPDGYLTSRMTLNMDYGSINLEHSSSSTLYMQEIHDDLSDEKYNLSPVVDEANSDVCTEEEENNVGDDEKDVDTSSGGDDDNNTHSATFSLTILIVCLTLTVLIVSILLVTVYVYKHKKNRMRYSIKK
uniref:Fibroblast growth factor 3 n=1 Tax=Erinnyis ello granulovirus TaxID=307444 RepID=A0A288WIR3_9BBAC|nr:fibroblast growth factor 3 [Erinnyis ello granulovirus]ARX72117.1 fibroblast growth factor 3 [Erinnyis ello granulovirus]